MFQGALRLPQCGETAGAVVSIDQGCCGVHHHGGALVGQLRLVWLGGPGLTEVVGWLGCLDPAPIYAVKVVGECKLWHSLDPPTHRQLQQLPCQLGGFKSYFLYILVTLLSHDFYFLWPSVDESAPGTSLLSSALQFAASGVGAPFVTTSQSLSVL